MTVHSLKHSKMHTSLLWPTRQTAHALCEKICPPRACSSWSKSKYSRPLIWPTCPSLAWRSLERTSVLRMDILLRRVINERVNNAILSSKQAIKQVNNIQKYIHLLVRHICFEFETGSLKRGCTTQWRNPASLFSKGSVFDRSHKTVMPAFSTFSTFESVFESIRFHLKAHPFPSV